MSLDSSRFTFDPWRDFLGVLMQQGRVQLDSDWNEWVAQLERRLQAGTLDTLGPAVVPLETPDGFLILLAAGKLTIGRGRIYVDGLLAENHGELPVPWDSALAEEQVAAGVPVTDWNPVLAELRARGAVDYERQPYYPDAPALPDSGNYLVYLDVWQREVTWLQQPDLIEKAVGVDTTARLQTVWQVKLLPLREGGQITCATLDENIPGWTEATASSAGRLTTLTADVPGQPDPCIIPPSGGYKGLENQLYRVEIHDGGVPSGLDVSDSDVATFKWSRDNASVATRVVSIPDPSHLVVASTGKDDVLRFSDGDWIEITDDWLELNNLPGEIRRIPVGGGVDDATRTIALETPLTAGLFPVDAQNVPDPARHTRIRRWDQKGKVLKSNGTEYCDLDTTGGVIPVPTSGTELLLENGVAVRFDLDPTGGVFKACDCWAFAARATDASIEILDKVPPRAIHHHYARLAVVDEGTVIDDCREFWPPEVNQTVEEGCDCSVCVTAEGHNSGVGTLQEAVNAMAQTGGTICLGVGTYYLRDTLQIADAHAVRLRGQGPKTILIAAENDVAIAIIESENVTLENFAVLGPARESESGLVGVANTSFARLSGLDLRIPPSRTGSCAAVMLTGLVMGLTVKDCVMMADMGIVNWSGEGSAELIGGLAPGQPIALLTWGLNVSDNLILGFRHGVRFTGRSLHYMEVRVAGNSILFCRDVGLTALGAVLSGSAFNVIGNTLDVLGSGIVVGTDGARICDNDVAFLGRIQSGDGIALALGLDPDGMDHCQVIGNRIAAAPKANEEGTMEGSGRGIVIRTRVNSAMIKQNVIDGVSAGIVMEKGGSADYLSIENNQLLDIAAGPGRAEVPLAAITILATAKVDIINNYLQRFARDAVQSPRRVALQAVGPPCIRIIGNRFHGVGPTGEFAGETVAVEILGSFARADVCENIITRAADASDKLTPGNWQALRAGSTAQEPFLTTGPAFAYAEDTSNAALFTATNVYRFAIRGGEFTARGNHMESGDTTLALAEVDGFETCLFSDNYCTLTFSEAAPILLQNVNVSVSGNRLRAAEEIMTMRIVTAETARGKDRGIIIGNFTSGDILLNDESIFNHDTWAALNVRT